jgi:hypothetical protein
MMGARALSGDASPRANIWRLALGNALLNHQESAGCARDSWDPVGVWGREGGRVYATATSAIALRAALDG